MSDLDSDLESFAKRLSLAHHTSRYPNTSRMISKQSDSFEFSSTIHNKKDDSIISTTISQNTSTNLNQSPTSTTQITNFDAVCDFENKDIHLSKRIHSSSIKKREKLQKISRLTALMSESEHISIIYGTIFLQDELSQDDLIDALKCRVVDKFARFRSVVQKNYFVEVEHVDILKHVKQIELKDPNSESELQRVLSSMVNRPFDETRPLWDCLSVRYRGGSVLMLRVHHVIGDGQSLATVFGSLCDQDLDGDFGPFGPQFSNVFHKFCYFVVFMIIQLLNLFRVMWKSVYTVFGESDPIGTPIKIHPTQLTKRKNLSWTPKMSVEDIKQVGRPYGATLNDVLLNVIAGGLTRYSKKRGKKSIVDVRCIHPINVRTSAKIQNLGNEVSFLFPLLPIGMDDPVERLVEIKSRMDLLKQYNEKSFSNLFIQLSDFIPEKLLQGWMSTITGKTTVAVSNVRGPDCELSIKNSKIVDAVGFLPPMYGIGLAFCIFSYNNGVRIGMTTDSNLIKNPQLVIHEMKEEFKSLQAKCQKM